MILSYDATLDDLCEPALRQYFRSTTAAETRQRSAVYGAILMGAATCLMARGLDPAYLATLTILGALGGAALNFVTYRNLATKRIRKYLGRETEGRVPARTVYSLEDSHLTCSCLGTTVTFSLSDLESPTEDERYLELRFGKSGLCTIPLRVFFTPSEKDDFLKAIGREPSIPENP